MSADTPLVEIIHRALRTLKFCTHADPMGTCYECAARDITIAILTARHGNHTPRHLRLPSEFPEGNP